MASKLKTHLFHLVYNSKTAITRDAVPGGMSSSSKTAPGQNLLALTSRYSGLGCERYGLRYIRKLQQWLCTNKTDTHRCSSF